ncbi:hemin ABC transporter substrate-binding protein, partial [Methylobacterium sp. WL19]
MTRVTPTDGRRKAVPVHAGARPAPGDRQRQGDPDPMTHRPSPLPPSRRAILAGGLGLAALGG